MLYILPKPAVITVAGKTADMIWIVKPIQTHVMSV
jgi:hypothetical protein